MQTSKLLFWLLGAATFFIVAGQEVGWSILCFHNYRSARPFSSGVIKHNQADQSSPCILILNGFGNGSYISLPNVDLAYKSTCTSIIINGNDYCVNEHELGRSIILQLETGELNITLPNPAVPNFTLAYYSNVAACGDDIIIPEEPQANQLQGVISSSYDPTQLVYLGRCYVYVARIPSPPATLKFELLYSSQLTGPINIDKESWSPFRSNESTLIVTSDTTYLQLIYTHYSSRLCSFIISFKVIYCENTPDVKLENGKVSVPDGPNLPGAKITFTCNYGWYISGEDFIECKVSYDKAYWSEFSQTECSPVAWCLTAPAEVENANFEYTSNTTAVYRCFEGYTTDNSNSERTIRCNPPLEAGSLWTWSQAKIICKDPYEEIVTATLETKNGNKEKVTIAIIIWAGCILATFGAVRLWKVDAKISSARQPHGLISTVARRRSTLSSASSPPGPTTYVPNGRYTLSSALPPHGPTPYVPNGRNTFSSAHMTLPLLPYYPSERSNLESAYYDDLETISQHSRHAHGAKYVEKDSLFYIFPQHPPKAANKPVVH